MNDELGLLEEEPKEQKALTVRVATVLDEAKGRSIKNHKEYEIVANFLINIKIARKDLNDYWDSSINKAKATLSDLKKKKGVQSLPLDQAEKIVKGKMKVWDDAEEAKREKAREEAREKQRIAEEKRQAAIEAAKKSEEVGEPVDEKVQEAMEVSAFEPEVVVDESPKVAGISYSDHWVWECTDFSKVPDGYKVLDKVKINSLVRGMKDDTNIPGIRPYNDKTLNARV